jgi:hypothetical protein
LLFAYQLSPLLLFLACPVLFFGTRIAYSFTVVPIFLNSGGVEFVLELFDGAALSLCSETNLLDACTSGSITRYTDWFTASSQRPTHPL